MSSTSSARARFVFLLMISPAPPKSVPGKLKIQLQYFGMNTNVLCKIQTNFGISSQYFNLISQTQPSRDWTHGAVCCQRSYMLCPKEPTLHYQPSRYPHETRVERNSRKSVSENRGFADPPICKRTMEACTLPGLLPRREQGACKLPCDAWALEIRVQGQRGRPHGVCRDYWNR